VETLISLVGVPPVGFEFLEYLFKCGLVMLFAGLAIYLVSYLMGNMIDMGR
jgi:hypothetical protein